MADEAVSYSVGKVKCFVGSVRVFKSFYKICKKEGVTFVPEFFRCVVAFLLFKQLVEAVFSVVAEGSVSNIVTHCNGVCKFCIKSKVFCNFRSN